MHFWVDNYFTTNLILNAINIVMKLSSKSNYVISQISKKLEQIYPYLVLQNSVLLCKICLNFGYSIASITK